MSDFAITNLMELENVAAQRTPDVDARFARQHIDSEHLGVSYFRYAPGFRSRTGHSHREQEEAYVVVGGSGRVKLDGKVRELRRWALVRGLLAQCGQRSLDRGAVTPGAYGLEPPDLLGLERGIDAQRGDRLLPLELVAVDADDDPLAGVDLALVGEGGLGDLALGVVALDR